MDSTADSRNARDDPAPGQDDDGNEPESEQTPEPNDSPGAAIANDEPAPEPNEPG